MSGARLGRLGERPWRHGGELVISWLVLLALIGSAPAVAQSQDGIQITGVSVADEQIVASQDGVVYLWQSDSQTLTVDVETGRASGEGHYEVCLSTTVLANGTTEELQCRETVLAGNRTEAISFRFETWPEELRGRQRVTAVVTAGTLTRDEVANASTTLHVLRRTADLDGDGLTNEEEVTAETSFTDADTDGDGLADGLERDTYGTDPTVADTDGDGLDDGVEVHEAGTDPTDADSDGDGLADAAERRDHGTNPLRADTDGDGLADSTEVNTYGTDPTHPDTDGDGLDDRAEVDDHDTEPTSTDTDGDGLGDALEVLTYGTNPRKADTDADGLDDGVEVYETHTDPTAADTDGDGLKDGPEVNAHGTNPNRPDTDGDGLNDGAELRKYDTDPTLADTDGDGVGDRAEVGTVAPFVPRWGATAVAVIGALALIGALWVRRRGYPRRLRALGLGRASGTVPEGEPDPSITEIPPPNRQFVLDLLKAHGGRMKQTAIVEESDWSKAKVSRVLQQMEQDDQVTKISVGRENIVTLPGAEPEHSRRPFDGDGVEGLAED